METDKVSKLWNESADKGELTKDIGILQRLLWLSDPMDHTSPLKSEKEQFDLMAKVNAHIAHRLKIGTFTAMMMSSAIDEDKRYAILDNLARCCHGTAEWEGSSGNGAKTRAELSEPPTPSVAEPPKTVIPPRPAPEPKLTVPRLLREFIPKQQASAIRSCMQGEEGKHFSDMLAGWVSKIKAMPLYYSQEKIPNDEKVVHLHYFSSSMDWYITEMDPEAFTPDEDYPQGPGPNRVFGLSCMQCNEWGPMSILEMCESTQVTFDEDWKAKTIGEIFTDKETAGDDDCPDCGVIMCDPCAARADRHEQSLLDEGKEVKACQFCSLPVTEEGMEICDSCNPTEPTDECSACRRVKVTGAIMHCVPCGEEIRSMEVAEKELKEDNEAEGEVKDIEGGMIGDAIPLIPRRDEAGNVRWDKPVLTPADVDAEVQAVEEALFPHATVDDPYIQGQKDDIEEVINPAKASCDKVVECEPDKNSRWIEARLLDMEVSLEKRIVFEITEQTASFNAILTNAVDELNERATTRDELQMMELRKTLKNMTFKITTQPSD